MKCNNRECEDADNSSSGCKRLGHAMDKYCDNYVAEATPPPKQSGTMERALEMAVESTVLRHECNSSRMTLCKRGGDYEQCLKCWQDYFISKAQQEEGK